VVVVGAGLAGLRAAEAVLSGDERARVSLLGQEAVAPYTRPPLSKAVLAGSAEVGALALRQRTQLPGRLTLRLSSPVVGSDLERREVTLADEGVVAWDGLVVASGLRARRLDVPGPTAGRYALRSAADALALRSALGSARHVVVVGAGVLGCEIASTASAQGRQVTLLDRASVPLHTAVGPVVGRCLQALHERHGVAFRGGETVAACTGGGVVDGVELTSGTHLPADLVVEAVGGLPNTEWLDAGSVDLAAGVLTGNDLLVEGRPEVAACGDVVRFPNRCSRGCCVASSTGRWPPRRPDGRGAHWSAAGPRQTTPSSRSDRVPYSWSEQHGLTVQGLGMTEGSDETVVLEQGAAGEAVFGHLRGGGLVGVTLLGMGSRLPVHRERLEVALGLR
jgi:NADPH-dependent 2,4-dienoyl-CoA reductase/sulfur reductase-like enzyme